MVEGLKQRIGMIIPATAGEEEMQLNILMKLDETIAVIKELPGHELYAGKWILTKDILKALDSEVNIMNREQKEKLQKYFEHKLESFGCPDSYIKHTAISMVKSV